MANIYDMSDTWNDGATTFTAIKMDVTDTASASASLLMDLQVGGSSKFKIGKTGFITVQSGAGIQPRPSSSGIALVGSNPINAFGVRNSFASLTSSMTFGWVDASNPDAPQDVSLVRDAANTLAQRNGTNAQTFNLYNTYTDASNYERGFMKWNSNVLEIGTEAAGTGSDREILLNAQTVRVFRSLTVGDQGGNSAGVNSLAVGDNASATGTRSIAVAGFAVSASGQDAAAFGRLASADKNGVYVFGSGSSGSQTGLIVFAKATTDATPTEMSTGFNRFLGVDESEALWCEVTVIGRSDGGADHAVFRRAALIERTGTTTSLIGSEQTLGSDVGSNAGVPPSGWDVTLAANDTDDRLAVTVTGASATNIQWCAKVEFTEVTNP